MFKNWQKAECYTFVFWISLVLNLCLLQNLQWDLQAITNLVWNWWDKGRSIVEHILPQKMTQNPTWPQYGHSQPEKKVWSWWKIPPQHQSTLMLRWYFHELLTFFQIGCGHTVWQAEFFSYSIIWTRWITVDFLFQQGVMKKKSRLK